MARFRRLGWLAGLLALAPVAAMAQAIGEPEEDEEIAEAEIGVRAGVATFTGGLGAVTGVGPSWAVQADIRRNEMVDWELAYVGSRVPTTLGGAIWRNGVQGALRISPAGEGIDPYVGAGIGASLLNPNNAAEPAFVPDDILGSDLVGEVPLMAGVQFGAGQVTAGVRGTYHLLFGDELAGGGNAFTATATLGGVF